MEATPSPSLPTWVRKRDGSTEPFDADHINRSLFAATEHLGRADAFIARELTDSVVHFLAQECDGGSVPSSQIADTLAKVVRELGQPQLAAAFLQLQELKSLATEREPVDAGLPDRRLSAAVGQLVELERSPLELQRRLASQTLSSFSLEEVFSRDLTSACREGLLLMGGLGTPLEMDSAVIRPSSAGGGLAWASDVFETLEHARNYIGRAVAIDSPEREFIQRGARIGDAAVWIKELARAARTLGLEIVLNLGCETLPAWAAETASGPLFMEQARHESSQGVLAFLDGLTDHGLQLGTQGWLRIDWHLSPRDFEEAGGRRLGRLVRAALAGAPVAFVCDRPRREVSLAEGLDRNHQAALLWVGLHLPTLLARHDHRLEAEAFLQKIMSLARLAASAGVQKRDFLRQHGRPERPAFLLERAHLGMCLVGLPEAVAKLFAAEYPSVQQLAAFHQELLRRLAATLQEEGRHRHLKCILDDPPADALQGCIHDDTVAEDVPAILKQAGRRHTLLGRGSLLLQLLPDMQADPQRVIDLLRHALEQATVNRIRLCRSPTRETQLTTGWNEGEGRPS